jgi:3-hydroxymyristoyl/3-hydroxydecanoyl-(acyl carrier protein) dehydratase
MPVATVRIPASHPAFAGHFPGRPIVPGVLLLAEVVEALLAHGSAAPLRLGAVKFVAPVGPDAELRIEWDEPVPGATRLRFEVAQLVDGQARRSASGHFELPAAAP